MFHWGDLWLCFCFCVLLHTALQWFAFLHPLQILCYPGHCFCRCIFIQYLVLYYFIFLYTLSLLFWPGLYLFLLIELTLCICYVSNTAFCALCTSTPWTQTKTCSLLTSLVSYSTVNSLMISAVMVCVHVADELFFQSPVIFFVYTICSLYS